jgi:stage V sporulation protein D (sporulation-specific penicillin-binding protein)
MAGVAKQREGRQVWRLWAVVLVLGMSAAGLTARLAYLQILEHPERTRAASEEHFGERELPAHRGAILDRNGYPLATSIDAWDVAVDRKLWADEKVALRAAEKLAPLLGRTAGEIFSMTGGERTGTVSIARQVGYEAGRKIIGAGLPGVIVELTSRRVYPEGNSAAALIGFTGRDQHGLTGLEADLDEILTGRPGRVWFERDSLGNPIPFGYRRQQDPVPGRDVLLTIDRTIQRMAERELDEAIRKHQAKGGTIIIQDPRNGEILAMVSRPSFDRATLDLSNPEQMELVRNRVVTDQYEPGSVFKLLTVAAAIDTGKVTPNSTYNDTGSALVGERIFRNWDYSTNGITDMRKVLVKSLNTGTVWLADKVLGPETFYRYVREFGFGTSTASGMTGDAPGMYRLPTDPAWYRADLASNSFGQGISVTPLQVINMVSAIANGGTLMRPSVQRETRGIDGVSRTEPREIRRVLNESAARTVSAMMRDVVDENFLARVPGYSAAGKSGTAYVPTVVTDSRGDAYTEEVTIPSYVGFAPLSGPRIAILVKLDHLSSADFGGVLTAPVFARLTRDILAYLRVPPDRPETLTREIGSFP